MAHRGQDHTFGLTGFLRLFLGRTQFARSLRHRLLQTAKMLGQPAVALTNLVCHLVETGTEAVKFQHADFLYLDIVTTGGKCRHAFIETLERQPQLLQMTRLQAQGKPEDGRKHSAEQQ